MYDLPSMKRNPGDITLYKQVSTCKHPLNYMRNCSSIEGGWKGCQVEHESLTRPTRQLHACRTLFQPLQPYFSFLQLYIGLNIRKTYQNSTFFWWTASANIKLLCIQISILQHCIWRGYYFVSCLKVQMKLESLRKISGNSSLSIRDVLFPIPKLSSYSHSFRHSLPAAGFCSIFLSLVLKQINPPLLFVLHRPKYTD